MRNTNKTTRNHKAMEELAYQRSIKADKIRVIRERLQPTLNHLLRLFMTQQSDDTNEYHGYQITFDYALTTEQTEVIIEFFNPPVDSCIPNMIVYPIDKLNGVYLFWYFKYTVSLTSNNRLTRTIEEIKQPGEALWIISLDDFYKRSEYLIDMRRLRVIKGEVPITTYATVTRP